MYEITSTELTDSMIDMMLNQYALKTNTQRISIQDFRKRLDILTSHCGDIIMRGVDSNKSIAQILHVVIEHEKLLYQRDVDNLDVLVVYIIHSIYNKRKNFDISSYDDEFYQNFKTIHHRDISDIVVMKVVSDMTKLILSTGDETARQLVQDCNIKTIRAEMDVIDERHRNTIQEMMSHGYGTDDILNRVAQRELVIYNRNAATNISFAVAVTCVGLHIKHGVV